MQKVKSSWTEFTIEYMSNATWLYVNYLTQNFNINVCYIASNRMLLTNFVHKFWQNTMKVSHRINFHHIAPDIDSNLTMTFSP